MAARARGQPLELPGLEKGRNGQLLLLSRSSSMPSMGKPIFRKPASTANLEATQTRLREVLLGKYVIDSTAGGRKNPTQAKDPGLIPMEEEDADTLSPPPSPPAGGTEQTGVPPNPQDTPKQKSTVSYEEPKQQEPPPAEEPRFGADDRAKEAFIAQVCSENTRPDVQEWVARMYHIMQKAPKEKLDDPLAKKRGGPPKGSDGSNSDTTSQTGTASALMTAGGSMAGTNAASRKAPSLRSGESMKVHPGQKIEMLGTEERLRAYLRNEIPELTAHVDKFVAKRAEEVRREIDEEVVESHLLQMRRQQVFDGKANSLRWQNSRRILLTKRLDSETPLWMLEAVRKWDQKTAMKHRQEEVSEHDLIFDYLTKRAAHINTSKLASEIPIFKTLHSTYSLPPMWRDKYLEMF